MKDKVWEYLIAPSRDKIQTWEECIFVVDADILLNLYRYTAEARNALFRSMETVKDNLWLPYYAAFDFARRRCDVIYETLEKYNEIQKKVDQHLKSFAKDLYMSEDDPSVIEMKKAACEWTENLKKKNAAVTDPAEDSVLERVLELFSGKVGDAWTEEQLQAMTDEGKKRQENRIPPEYTERVKDQYVPEYQIYENSILWRQMMAYASREYRDIIFITDRISEDWWHISKGSLIGPRAEMKKEFYQETGQNFHMYTAEDFLRRCAERAGSSVSSSIIL